MQQSMPRNPPMATSRREGIGPWIASVVMQVCLRSPVPLRVLLEPDLSTNDFAELLIGLRGLQPAVEIDCGLDVSVSEQAFNDFVGAGIVPQIDCRSGVAKLVNGDPQAGRVFHALRDLSAKHARRFRRPAHAWKQAVRARSAQQVRTVITNV